ncbi:hypothetical protein LTS08_002472 [Lithohypha guttulata]|uniref:GST C-terminal domain-containing protein n=1 Tax=Lithohypha guttulata TaxID=1690604 RepID=A0AAN7YJN7_9EURO|nr:hypothetical protein LTR51_001642 [Lithohypha guttulata]KAK5090618.1 hypothetical protein LTR05_000793 [Lithohypha guttulata]KAK5104581.1 hypothetical protein LTS08_002472 [Lithohypha guttulata]
MAKQAQVIADGMCDACVLVFFENQREYPSKEWTDRQLRKVRGGLKALDGLVGERQFIIGNSLTLADIAAGCVLGYMTVRFKIFDWRAEFPRLAAYTDRLEERPSFKDSAPYPQTIKDKIV